MYTQPEIKAGSFVGLCWTCPLETSKFGGLQHHLWGRFLCAMTAVGHYCEDIVLHTLSGGSTKWSSQMICSLKCFMLNMSNRPLNTAGSISGPMACGTVCGYGHA